MIPKSYPNPPIVEDEKWTAFLNGLSGNYADAARALWGKLVRSVPQIRIPQAGPTPDGSFQLVWDRGEHHVEVDVYPEGHLEWFYRNRRTGEVEGADEQIGDLPPLLVKHLESCAFGV